MPFQLVVFKTLNVLITVSTDPKYGGKRFSHGEIFFLLKVALDGPSRSRFHPDRRQRESQDREKIGWMFNLGSLLSPPAVR